MATLSQVMVALQHAQFKLLIIVYKLAPKVLVQNALRTVLTAHQAQVANFVLHFIT